MTSSWFLGGTYHIAVHTINAEHSDMDGSLLSKVSLWNRYRMNRAWATSNL